MFAFVLIIKIIFICISCIWIHVICVVHFRWNIFIYIIGRLYEVCTQANYFKDAVRTWVVVSYESFAEGRFNRQKTGQTENARIEPLSCGNFRLWKAWIFWMPRGLYPWTSHSQQRTQRSFNSILHLAFWTPCCGLNMT